MRVDFNVPQDKEGMITDDSRIKASLPSIKYVLDNGGSLILMSHLGRPKGEPNSEFSLKPVAERLGELLGCEVMMASDCIGPEVEQTARKLKPGQILLLENLRFHDAEEKPDSDPSFAKKLASLGDVYVNDAFGTAHRAHSSTVSIAKLFPGAAAAGFLMEKEIKFLGAALLAPKHPFIAIIGGAKISSKLGVIKALLEKVDTLLIGGGMAYTFLRAQGIEIGDSIVEDDLIGEAKELLALASQKGVKLLLPEDIMITDKICESGQSRIIPTPEGIPDGMMGVDIGPKTIKAFNKALETAQTVLWNGPVGVFEIPAFSQGTHAIAKTLANLSATTIVGGGDSIAAIQEVGVADKISHISTGGGASLEFIEYGTLPGIEALSSSKQTAKA